MRERLTKTATIIHTLITMFFSLMTSSLVNAQFMNVNRRAEKVPDFTYLTLDGNKFTKNDLKKDSRLLIVYFNPTCEICQKEIQHITDNIGFFNDIQIIMVSPNAKEEIIKFRNDYNLNQYPQITMLQDADDHFYKEFNAQGYPSLYLYDHEKNMLTQYDGYANFEEIKEVFDQAMAAKK